MAHATEATMMIVRALGQLSLLVSGSSSMQTTSTLPALGADMSSMQPIKSFHDTFVQQTIAGHHQPHGFRPSPDAWEDQLIYFFLPDRFSDGTEDAPSTLNPAQKVGSALFKSSDWNNALGDEASRQRWMESGKRFIGGTLKAAESKLGYLQRLAITALWLGPVLQQVRTEETYHGYAAQDFLDIDGRFGTREDLRSFVRAAHAHGIYVILDIVLNHAGDVFVYDYPGAPHATVPYADTPYNIRGWFDSRRDEAHLIPYRPVNDSLYPQSYPGAAIWPRELQRPNTFQQRGQIQDWNASVIRGDFYELKSFDLGYSTDTIPNPTLLTLTEIYKFWLSYADLDGFRIDTVRHLGPGPTKYFTTAIREYAKSIGKKNLFIVGEVSGNNALQTLRAADLDAVVGNNLIQQALFTLNTSAYFDLFSASPDGNVLFTNKNILTMLDDHDQSWQPGPKRRFSAAGRTALLEPALGLNLCSLGIPTIYYGTEQAFDGDSARHTERTDYADRFIREAMFGGDFGAFGSRRKHFFDETGPVYQFVATLAAVRRREIALRRGKQVVRRVMDADQQNDSGHAPKDVVAWSRIYDRQEILCVMSTSPEQRSVRIEVDDQMAFRQIFPQNDGSSHIPEPGQEKWNLVLQVSPMSFSLLQPDQNSQELLRRV